MTTFERGFFSPSEKNFNTAYILYFIQYQSNCRLCLFFVHAVSWKMLMLSLLAAVIGEVEIVIVAVVAVAVAVVATAVVVAHKQPR